MAQTISGMSPHKDFLAKQGDLYVQRKKETGHSAVSNARDRLQHSGIIIGESLAKPYQSK